MRVTWLCPYPVSLLEPELLLKRKLKNYPPCSWIVNLSNAISKTKDVELHIITHTPLIAKSQTLFKNNVTFHILKHSVPFTNKGFPPYLPLNFLSGFYFERKKMVCELNKIKPDIVHCHGTEGAFSLAGTDSTYPCIISMQGIINKINEISPSMVFRLTGRFEKQALQKTNFVGCRTSFDKNFVKEVNPNVRIFDLPEAMAPVFFSNTWKDKGSQNLLYVGTLTDRKGSEFIIQVLRIIKERYTDVSLNLVGNAAEPYKKYLEDLCMQWGLSKNVQFSGFKNALEISKLHLASDIFVFPSKNDNSPNAVAEAMVSGLPVVSTNVGGIPSMIDNNNTGVLVEKDNIKQMAAAIMDLFEDKTKRIMLSKNAKLIARKRHFPETVARKTIDTYKVILNGDRPN